MSDRDVIRVSGPDSLSYLQGQLSQDVAALGIGDSAFSLLLQPQGKVDAWLRVTRTDDDVFVLDVDAGWADHVVARLRRFMLRVKVDIEVLDWDVAVLADADAAPPADTWSVVSEVAGTTTLLGPVVPGGMPADVYDALRIEAMVPRMGSELDESTIPAAAGLVDRSVSFTKGCYTGQELVARIDSRGDRTPTRLRRIRGDVPVGATLQHDDTEVGRITSAVPGVALAYVRRTVEPPAVADARWDGGAATVTIEA
jgi:folate-binding protein YgfZ